MKRILIAEDEIYVRFLYKETLDGIDALIDEAEDGEEALDLIYENDYNIIMLDLNMPYVNGLEVLEEMKEKDLINDTKIIILSAFGETLKFKELEKFKVCEYIQKPIDIKVLKSTVEKWLK